MEHKGTKGNSFGQYRKCPDISEFEEYFEQRGDVTVLRGFLNNAATWVMVGTRHV